MWAPRRLNGDEFAALSQVKWLRAGRAASGVPDFAVAVNAFGELERLPRKLWDLPPYGDRGLRSALADTRRRFHGSTTYALKSNVNCLSTVPTPNRYLSPCSMKIRGDTAVTGSHRKKQWVRVGAQAWWKSDSNTRSKGRSSLGRFVILASVCSYPVGSD